MNKIESENTEALVGVVESPNQRFHLFKSAVAMADFIDTFKISHWQARTGITAAGEYAIELVYLPEEN